MRYKINVTKKSSGVYEATCEEIPQIVTHAMSIDEAKQNVKEAIEMFLVDKGTIDSQERVDLEEKIKRIKNILRSLEEEKKGGIITEEYYLENRARHEQELEDLERELIK